MILCSNDLGFFFNVLKGKSCRSKNMCIKHICLINIIMFLLFDNFLVALMVSS